MMNSLLVTTILFTICTISLARLTQPKSLANINKLRQQIGMALDNNITVPDLTWDANLAKQAEQSSPDCNHWGYGPNFRYFPEMGDDNAKKLENFFFLVFRGGNMTGFSDEEEQRIRQIKEQSPDWQKAWSMMHLEALNPKQSRIGCGVARCTGTVPPLTASLDGLSLEGWRYSYEHRCLVGPSESWDPAILKKISRLNDGNG